MASLNRGDRLAGRFLLVRRLGTGTTESWAADDLEAGGRRALKVAEGEARAALSAEALILARVAHPAIAACVGTFEHGEALLLVTEFVPGGDCGSLRGGPWRATVSALRPAIAALAHAHALGVAHGDLKPANLVRDRVGAARLVDFGVAAAAVTGRPSRGSPYSRSPAQWDGAAPTTADDAYGLGALLYELLAGAPPHYPDIDAARAARAPIPPLVAPHDLPERLTALVAELMDENPAARPTVDAVGTELDALLAVDDAVLASPGGVTASRQPSVMPLSAPTPALVPPPRPLVASVFTPAAAAAHGRDGRRRGVRSPGVVAGGVLLAGAALLVFVVLPRWVVQHPAEVTVAGSTPSPVLEAKSSSAPKALPTTPQGLAELAQAKTRAEEARSRFDKSRQALDAAHADLWGGADWTRLAATAGEAAHQYEMRDYAAAAASWAVADELARRVGDGRAPALAATLAAGRAALGRGDSAAAVSSFERALTIEPGSREATAALARARGLDRVLSLVDAGAAAEKSGDLGAAATQYRAALALDPATSAASAGLARIAARERGAAFAGAMAAGQKALAAGDRSTATAAFRRAAAIEPGAPGVQDALQQLGGLDRSASIARLKADAEAAERDERWADAQKAFDAALAQDSTLVFAQQGRARALPRAALDDRLEGFLRHPERLYAPEGRAAARAAIADARATGAAGPVLGRQIEALGHALVAAETPLQLPLASDNQTEVVVYRVGRLGTFGERQLELLPGRYTIVGKRAGYRDVRREVLLAPGVPFSNAIDIRCTEPI
jgi:tetratricopeptide (TPR) repeat protein